MTDKKHKEEKTEEFGTWDEPISEDETGKVKLPEAGAAEEEEEIPQEPFVEEEEDLEEGDAPAKEEVEEAEEDEDLESPDVLNTAAEIPVVVSAVIGQTRTTVKEILEFRPGFVIDLHRAPGETVDVMAGGKLIARGELVEMDGKLGVRILKLLR